MSAEADAHAGGMRVPDRFDIVVIGAGIIGCLVARELRARRPTAVIGVVEQGAVGSGASRYSAGLHFPRGATEALRTWAGFSQQFYQRLLADDPNLPIRALPMVVALEHGADVRFPDHYLPEARPRRAETLPWPLESSPVQADAWWIDGGQYADVGRLAAALAARLRDTVPILDGVAVVALDEERDHVRLQLADGTSLVADAVVVAPGPWVRAPAWGALVEPLGIRVKKVVALHVALPATSTDCVVVLEQEDAFLLPLPERGHWLFSYTRVEWDVDPSTMSASLTAADLDEGRAVLARWSPALAGLTYAGRVFCDAYSTTRAPEVRRIGPRILFAGAANGSGYRYGPAIASRAADILLDSAEGGLP